MLVRLHHDGRTGVHHDRERGAVLLTVMIVMFVLAFVAIVVAAIVVNTTGTLVSGRSTAQARVAADAGLAEALATAKRTQEFCDLELSSSDPHFTVTSSCSATEPKEVTFISTGSPGAGEVKTQAVYSYTESPVGLAGAAELVFFNSAGNNVYFTNHVLPHADSSLATVLFPAGGGFECKTVVPANVLSAGPFIGQAGCRVKGSLYAGGTPAFVQKMQGQDIPLAAYLNNNDIVEGDLVANGNTHLGGSSRIDGTLTMPTGRSLYSNGSRNGTQPTSDSRVKAGAAGGILYNPSLATPTFPTWYEFPYDSAADWPTYDKVTLTATSTPYDCTNFKGSATTFWTTYISGLTNNTVIDARACKGGWDTALGANANATLGVNLVLIGNAFTLGKLTLTPKNGTDPSAWFVVPDSTNDGKPTCPANNAANQWDYRIETDAAITVTVKSMLYTPCTIRIGAGGTWTGAMYAGDLNDGGDINIYPALMALPGQWGAGPSGSAGGTGSSIISLGNLVAQRDIP